MFEYIKKQNTVYSEKGKKLQELKIKLDSLIKDISDTKTEKQYIEEIESLKKEYNKQKKEYHNVLLARYLDFDDSVYAIAYLIGLIEGKNYSVKEYSTQLYHPFYPIYSKPNYSVPKSYNYKICYLVSEEAEEKATQELINRFCVSDENNHDCYYNINNNLKIPSNNYIQIAYYKGDNQKKIEYTFKNFVEIKDEPDTFIISQLCDKRYEYILNYIDRIICHKLDNDLKITLDEMMIIADEFANEYNKNTQKSLKK